MRVLEAAPAAATTDVRDRLRSDGYVYLPGFLPPERVAPVRDALADVLARHGWLRPGTAPRDLLATDHPVLPESGSVFPCYIAAQAVEALHALAHDPAITGPVAAVLGEPRVVVQPRKSVRMVQPRYRGFMTAAHQDFLHVQGCVDTVTAWVALAESPVRHGGLRVLAGSHRQGVVREGTVGIDVADDDPRWRTADFAPGDVVLFHALTVHASLPNVSDRIRLSCDFRYQRPGSPISDLQMRPIDCPGAPERWDDVTAGWRTAAWVSPGADVHIEPYREPSEPDLYRDLGRRAAGARLVDVEPPGSAVSLRRPRRPRLLGRHRP